MIDTSEAARTYQAAFKSLGIEAQIERRRHPFPTEDRPFSYGLRFMTDGREQLLLTRSDAEATIGALLPEESDIVNRLQAEELR